MNEKKKYDSTVARIAGNLLSGQVDFLKAGYSREAVESATAEAVRWARAIVAATEQEDEARR